MGKPAEYEVQGMGGGLRWPKIYIVEKRFMVAMKPTYGRGIARDFSWWEQLQQNYENWNVYRHEGLLLLLLIQQLNYYYYYYNNSYYYYNSFCCCCCCYYYYYYSYNSNNSYYYYNRYCCCCCCYYCYSY